MHLKKIRALHNSSAHIGHKSAGCATQHKHKHKTQNTKHKSQTQTQTQHSTTTHHCAGCASLSAASIAARRSSTLDCGASEWSDMIQQLTTTTTKTALRRCFIFCLANTVKNNTPDMCSTRIFLLLLGVGENALCLKNILY